METSIDRLLARMDALLAPMVASNDERRHFLSVYRRTTAAVRDELAHPSLGGFVDPRWTERWDRFKTSELPEMEALASWLRERLPPDPLRPGIVHGDFKLDNLMLDTGSPDRLVAVFDWELAALGEPLVDLGMLLVYWVRVRRKFREMGPDE